MSQDRKLTTATGCPIFDNQNSITARSRGPLLMQDAQLLEQMQQFNREQIPERVIYAKGAGAYGTFTVTRWQKAGGSEPQRMLPFALCPLPSLLPFAFSSAE